MKPIIFSTPMVRAILDGKKTQTRRVIKIDDAPENWKICIAGTSIVRTEPYDVKLPRYVAGDILWVRETWGVPISLAGDIIYKADFVDRKAPLADGEKWRPSIFMPREAARIFLRVKNVRVERLQDITEEDARAEGCSTKILNDGWKNIGTLTARDEFIALWEHLNAKRGLGWDTNPWVWVIEFERINKE